MPWIKSPHIVFMVAWFAGLFYLPRRFAPPGRPGGAISPVAPAAVKPS